MFWKKPRKDSQSMTAPGAFSLGGAALAGNVGNVVPGQEPVSVQPGSTASSNTDQFAKNDLRTRACCIVPKGRVLTGTFSFSAPVRIEGTMRGRIFSSSTVVIAQGARAEVEGNVSKLISSGSIQGSSFSATYAELRSTSTVDTRLVAKTVSASPGCTINGELLIGV